MSFHAFYEWGNIMIMTIRKRFCHISFSYFLLLIIEASLLRPILKTILISTDLLAFISIPLLVIVFMLRNLLFLIDITITW